MSARRLSIKVLEKLARVAKFRSSIMAELYGCHQRTLQRLFQERWNTTAQRFARELRCRDAIEKLRNGELPKQFYAELGFSSETHLCHEFQAILGRTPRSYYCPRPRKRQ